LRAWTGLRVFGGLHHQLHVVNEMRVGYDRTDFAFTNTSTLIANSIPPEAWLINTGITTRGLQNINFNGEFTGLAHPQKRPPSLSPNPYSIFGQRLGMKGALLPVWRRVAHVELMPPYTSMAGDIQFHGGVAIPENPPTLQARMQSPTSSPER